MAKGFIFHGYDSADEADSVEGFDVIQDGLREMFRENIAPYVIKTHGPDDVIAMREAFHDWTDSLCKDGEISEYVYDNIDLTDD